MTGLDNDYKISVRPMRLEDVEQVHAIDQVSFTLPWPKSAFLYELNENPGSFLWVAEAEEPAGQRVVGMVVVWMILDEAHIATIAVHPEYRQRGVGQSLLVTALKEAIRQGALQATLEVRAMNIAAQQLYRQLRFEVMGRRPHYYRDNYEDALIMTVGGLGESYLNWLESGEWRHKTGEPQKSGEPKPKNALQANDGG